MRNRKTKLCVFPFVLTFMIIWQILVSSGLAQTGGKIVGKILDAQSHEPLPGVTVRIENSQQGGVSDVEGDYYILNVPPGSHNIVATMVGYKNIIKTKVSVNVNHTTRVDFNMESTVVQLGQDVVVTAERPLVEKDETSTRHYVEATDIASRPTTQLTEILTTLPGIDLSATGELVVRRGSLDQVAFMIDGIRARNPLDFQPYTNINVTSIQELEIITGGFNAEYGEAQSGVFNIVTKDGTPNLTGNAEFRWTPPGLRHWGTAFYDYSTDRYWENTHARHLQWWIDHPNQWVDPNGTPGSDPKSIWTPEQAYQYYMATHQPLTDYTNESTTQEEISIGGPMPIKDMFFFISGKYREAPPITGNSIRRLGSWFDGNAKISYHLGDVKFMLSGFYGLNNSNEGMESIDAEFITGHGLENKYAYYDYPGYPENRTDGQTLQMTHVLSQSTFYQIQLSRVHRYKSQGTFPGDINGWETGVPQYDYLRATDAQGNPIVGGFSNIIGLHTTGYYYRGHDSNTDMTLSGNMTSQLSKYWQMKGGGGFTYYTLKRYQETKAFKAIEDRTYHPYEGNLYFQNKLEFSGLIMNLGLRFDFYNANDRIYTNIFDPFDTYTAALEGRAPNPQTEPTKTYGQLSPRIGISHPISERTVLHFSYGHFFQRASFGDYGEGTTVSGILNTYTVDATSSLPIPYNLGNRDLKPRKTVAYELGVEHNFGGLVADLTAFYKDITKTIRTVTVYTLSGGRYLTSGNGDYGDSKGIEISLNKPLTDLWGCYLNYSWSTGISGRSGDPSVIAPPGSNIQVSQNVDIGDIIQYDPSRLKFGFTIATPNDMQFLGSIFKNIQVSFDYQLYFPNENIASDVFAEAGRSYTRNTYRNADMRIRKEFEILGFKPAIYVEIRNVFNDQWTNLDVVKSSSPEDRVRFINSNFTVFPQTSSNGAPFPDMLEYTNLPRQVTFGLAIGF
ncbi:MAG: TonB-dependent receptor [Bacteroidota bacterium]|nr:TonB-dependent receptor [Bacteroidota bacterium]